jgi:hypothetical protein
MTNLILLILNITSVSVQILALLGLRQIFDMSPSMQSMLIEEYNTLEQEFV